MPTHIKIPRFPILIVEDTKGNQELLQAVCFQMGVASEIAGNGQIALEMAKSKKYSLFIVDIMLPVMDGKAFVVALKLLEPNPIVIIQSALDASETIIDVMRLGVFDYIVKPLDVDYLKHVITKALDYKHLKDMEKELVLNEGIRLRGQLEWLNYKETMRMSGKDSFQKNSIFNLSTSISQGGGFGISISLIDMLKSSMTEQNDSYLVNKEILDMVFENNEFSRRIIEGLTSVVNLMEEPFQKEEWSARQLVNEFPSFIKEIVPFLKNKNISIGMPTLMTECRIEIDLGKIQLVLEELLINAYKYSLGSSRIDILVHTTSTYFCIGFKNQVGNGENDGIPADKEKLVLEAFYRIHPPVEDIQSVEKFSLGLGLTVVDYIISKHNGMFFIHNALDHTGLRISNCVLAEVFLPIKM